MSYNDPKPQHKNAIAAVSEARQQALAAVSVVRETTIDTIHPNLAPADSNNPHIVVSANQKVIDYLLQLRPYRSTSENWNLAFGAIKLPETISGGSAPGRGRGTLDDLQLSGSPEVTLENASEVIEAVNETITYTGDGRLEQYKFVFGPRKLLLVVEHADEIAAEMDLLAELEDKGARDTDGF